jgi:NADH-ubiquinone oxidoreductase chain 5
LSAFIETDFKKIIALSTLRQLGIIIIRLGIYIPELAFFHLITHALFKALLFICAGSIIHLENNNQDIRLIGKIRSISPLNTTVFNVANLSLIGSPFLAGFYSKDNIIEIFFLHNTPLLTTFIITIRICSTAIYTTRILIFTLFTQPQTPNYYNFCRKYTYLSYGILTSGAVIGGAAIR